MTLIQIKVDDSELQSAFAQLTQRMDDLQPVMTSIGEYMVRATDDRFRNQQDPEGNPWAPLSAATLAVKRNNKILTERGRLRGSITYKATSNSVEIGTNLIYAPTHQFGATIRAKNKKYLYWKGASHPVKEVVIPARPFLGVSEQDEQKILGIIENYLI
jgi:phage virion morphogenesis protein